MRYRRYRTPTQSRRRRKLGVVLIALALTAVLVTVLLDRAIVPLAEGYAASNAKIYATELINQAVAAVLDEGGVTYDSLVRHTSLNDGTVKSVEADAIAIDRVKTNVIQKVNELASPGKTLKIPVGTLTNVWFLLGRGPSISIKLQFSPYVTTDLTSKFESAGINQTLHQMMLHVTGEIYILAPGDRKTQQVETDFCLAETILVGDVPDAYTNVTGGSLANNIADYGAQADGQ